MWESSSGPLHPMRLLAVGKSQSAFHLTTYIDAIQPLCHVFDGFLVHSRAEGAVPIPGGSPSGGTFGGAVRIRADDGVPVLMIDHRDGRKLRAVPPGTATRHALHQTLGLAGTSHAGSYIVTPSESQSLGCTLVAIANGSIVFESWLVLCGTPLPFKPRGTPRLMTLTRYRRTTRIRVFLR